MPKLSPSTLTRLEQLNLRTSGRFMTGEELTDPEVLSFLKARYGPDLTVDEQVNLALDELENKGRH